MQTSRLEAEVIQIQSFFFFSRCKAEHKEGTQGVKHDRPTKRVRKTGQYVGAGAKKTGDNNQGDKNQESQQNIIGQRQTFKIKARSQDEGNRTAKRAKKKRTPTLTKPRTSQNNKPNTKARPNSDRVSADRFWQ